MRTYALTNMEPHPPPHTRRYLNTMEHKEKIMILYLFIEYECVRPLETHVAEPIVLPNLPTPYM